MLCALQDILALAKAAKALQAVPCISWAAHNGGQSADIVHFQQSDTFKSRLFMLRWSGLLSIYPAGNGLLDCYEILVSYVRCCSLLAAWPITKLYRPISTATDGSWHRHEGLPGVPADSFSSKCIIQLPMQDRSLAAVHASCQNQQHSVDSSRGLMVSKGTWADCGSPA